MPSSIPERQHTLCEIGLVLAGCQKSVQIVNEHKVRPAEKLHEPIKAASTFRGIASDLTNSDIAREPDRLL